MSARTKNLVVIKVNQLGDNVIFLPALQEFIHRFPDWRLSILTTPMGREIFSHLDGQTEFKIVGAADFVKAWKSPRLFGPLLNWVWEQKAEALLLGVEPAHSAHLLAFLSGIPLRVGVRPPKWTIPGSLHLKTEWKAAQPIAEVNWRAASCLAEKLKGTAWPSEVAVPQFKHPAQESGQLNAPQILIHPGASREYQRWPAERYVELAARLQHAGLSVSLIGSSRDLSGLDASGVPTRLLKSFQELVTVLSQGKVFIGNNSGPMHVASALGLSSVIISGPSSPVWDPFWHREQIQVLREPKISCQPCDRWNLPADHCRFISQPLVCLKTWSVEVVERLVRARMETHK